MPAVIRTTQRRLVLLAPAVQTRGRSDVFPLMAGWVLRTFGAITPDHCTARDTKDVRETTRRQP